MKTISEYWTQQLISQPSTPSTDEYVKKCGRNKTLFLNYYNDLQMLKQSLNLLLHQKELEAALQPELQDDLDLILKDPTFSDEKGHLNPKNMTLQPLKKVMQVFISWSIPRHLELARWNLQVTPVVKTIFLIELRSGQEPLLIINNQGREIRLTYLPKEMWFKILENLNCGDFGPLALPTP